MPGRHAGSTAPWVPLRHTDFRALWLAGLLANLALWMVNVTAAWVMLSLGQAAIWVAAVQGAATLPVMLLGVPFGVLADRTDRRRMLLWTQAGLLATAVGLAALAFAGALSAAMLLCGVLAYGCGQAVRLPAFAASLPGRVPREHLPGALALNSASVNVSRVLGPGLAGLLIGGFGAAAAFAAVAAAALVALLLLAGLRRDTPPRTRQRLTYCAFLRGGLRFTLRSTALRGILAQTATFFFGASAMLALLPLVARDIGSGRPEVYTLMLAAMGCGAIAALWFVHTLRVRCSREGLAVGGACVHAVAMVVVAVLQSPSASAAAMVVVGAAWLSTSNPLTVAAQLALSERVRARGMAIYQAVMMGSIAIGSLAWGQVATWLGDARGALMVAAGALAALMLLLRPRVDRRE
jgi:predicted MFS family arabinose efflux permease